MYWFGHEPAVAPSIPPLKGLMSTQQINVHLTRMPLPVPELRMSVLRTGPSTEVGLHGVIDLHTAPMLDTLVDELVRRHDPDRLVLDLAEVRLLCAAGISALLRARELTAARSGCLVLRNPSPKARLVLEITGTTNLFHFAHD